MVKVGEPGGAGTLDTEAKESHGCFITLRHWGRCFLRVLVVVRSCGRSSLRGNGVGISRTKRVGILHLDLRRGRSGRVGVGGFRFDEGGNCRGWEIVFLEDSHEFVVVMHGVGGESCGRGWRVERRNVDDDCRDINVSGRRGREVSGALGGSGSAGRCVGWWCKGGDCSGGRSRSEAPLIGDSSEGCVRKARMKRGRWWGWGVGSCLCESRRLGKVRVLH